MEVNQNAPVVASDQIDVNADPGTVWEVISAIGAWPSWNPAVKTASLNGPLAEGTSLRPGLERLKEESERRASAR